MLGDKVGQNIVCSAAVDPEKKSDEHALNLKSSLTTVYKIGALHEMIVELYNPTVWLFQELCRLIERREGKMLWFFTVWRDRNNNPSLIYLFSQTAIGQP